MHDEVMHPQPFLRHIRRCCLLLCLLWLVAAPPLLADPVLADPVLADPVYVADADELRQALTAAEVGQRIVIMPGDYFLPSLRLRADGRPDAPITLEAATPGSVTLWSRHTVLFKVYGAHWQFKGLDFQGNHHTDHALHIVKGADGVVVEGNRFQNFHAAIKGNGEGSPRQFPDGVRLLRNIFINDAPRDTQAPVASIDVVGGRDWEISQNFIADIAHLPERSGRNTTAAFVKGGAHGATFDRNLIICEWRHRGGQRVGLSLGNGGSSSGAFDRRGMASCPSGQCPEARAGRVTNNIILNCPEEPGIYLNKASDALIANNTIYNAFGVQARFAQSTAQVRDNLLTGAVWERDGGSVQARGNLSTGWFALASHLPAVKRKLTEPLATPDRTGSPSLDAFKNTLAGWLSAGLDALGNSRVAKGLAPFDDWFVAPGLGELVLFDGERIIAQGSAQSEVSVDFCGRARTPPVDLGAIEYKAGDCSLQTELKQRHGPLFAELVTRREMSQLTPPWVSSTLDASGASAVLQPPELGSMVSAHIPRALSPPQRVLRADPSDYLDRVRSLQPGDWLQLAPGKYPKPLRLHNLRGTADKPIVITGPSDGEPAVLLGRRGHNTVSLINAAHIALRHLTLDGRHQPVAAVVAEADGYYAHDITLEHLRIHNYDASQGNTGITTRVPAWNWVIRHNEIRNVGTGLYLGRPDGNGPFINGLVEHNVIAATRGYNAQIKHQTVRDRLPGMPTTPQQTIIRYNVFSKARDSGDPGRARPNLLLGHWPAVGPGQNDQYLVYGNVFHQNPHERLLQAEGNVAAYNNLFFNPAGDAVIVRPHNDVPKRISLVNNTVIAGGFGLRIDEPDRDYPQYVLRNAIFADEPLLLPRDVAARDNLRAGTALGLLAAGCGPLPLPLAYCAP